MYRPLIYPLILLLTSAACSPFSPKSKPEVVAEVNKNQLFASDIALLIPPGLPREDSIAMLRQYINTWALAHLMEAKAQKELDKDQKDVSQALEEYRRSLLVFRYEKSFIETRIDTTITPEELKKVYKQNAFLFVLPEPIVKVRYIKMALASPYVERVRSLYRTKSIEETYQLEQMAQNSAEKYDTFNDQWISASILSKELPVTTDELIRAIDRHPDAKDKSLEYKDNAYAYYLFFFEVTPAGATAPIEYAENSIRNIILGNRKKELQKNLEKDVLEEGWRTKQLKVYFDEK